MSRKRFTHFWHIYVAKAIYALLAHTCRKNDLRTPSGKFFPGEILPTGKFGFFVSLVEPISALPWFESWNPETPPPLKCVEIGLHAVVLFAKLWPDRKCSPYMVLTLCHVQQLCIVFRFYVWGTGNLLHASESDSDSRAVLFAPKLPTASSTCTCIQTHSFNAKPRSWSIIYSVYSRLCFW